ncbi:MAG: proline--tRNA ligase, partial [Candidatus Bathyarchaeia archaeon]
RIIKRIIAFLEEKLEETGHDPMFFPVVISEDDFAKEAEHIEGFHAEVFWVTHAGKRKLEKKILLRPTSETAMYPMFAYWIRSHADLPLKIYQSVFVYRYETKATRPLLRMREFLWNEAHTSHKDEKDAESQIREAIKIYDVIYKRLGLSYLILKRPDFDKFAGALYSVAFDAWNPDGRVNQIGTVHNLGENFAKAFDITYEDINGDRKNVTQTCYGFGISRTLAAVIAQHGDDRGMVLPPEIAPIQAVIVPIPYRNFENEVKKYANEVYERIKNAGISVYLDEQEKTPGEKFFHWELFGVPVRIEVGPKDLKERCVTFSERVNLERTKVPFEDVVPALKELFEKIFKNLESKSLSFLKNVITDVDDMSSLKRAIKNKKIARLCWCEEIECAEIIKNESGGEIRGHKFCEEEKPENPCIVCGRLAKKVVYVARAY